MTPPSPASHTRRKPLAPWAIENGEGNRVGTLLMAMMVAGRRHKGVLLCGYPTLDDAKTAIAAAAHAIDKTRPPIFVDNEMRTLRGDERSPVVFFPQEADGAPRSSLLEGMAIENPKTRTLNVMAIHDHRPGNVSRIRRAWPREVSKLYSQPLWWPNAEQDPKATADTFVKLGCRYLSHLYPHTTSVSVEERALQFMRGIRWPDPFVLFAALEACVKAGHRRIEYGRLGPMRPFVVDGERAATA